MHSRTKSIALIGVALLATASGGQAKCYDWTNPDKDFVISDIDTVTHVRTGLVWDRCTWGLHSEDCEGGTAGTYDWAEALGVAETANAIGHKGHRDWRLPNKNELTSLVSWGCSPAINTNVFPDIPEPSDESAIFWTSTPFDHPYNPLNSSNAWIVLFNLGHGDVGTMEINPKVSNIRVRLVRGGH